MTQARLVNTIPQWSDCSVYRFIVRDPNTNYTTRRVGYIGETARMPLDRLIEHLRKQLWGDTIVGWEVIEDGHPDKESVLAAEKAAVEREKPLYNDEWNRANPDRIPIWDQKRQRAERDAARRAAGGTGMRTPSTPRPRQTPTTCPIPPRPARTTRLPAAWRRRLLKAAAFPGAVGVLWLLLALFVAPHVKGERWQAWPVLALALVTWATALWLVVPRVRGKDAKARRNNRLTATALVTVAVAVLAGALYGWATGN